MKESASNESSTKKSRPFALEADNGEAFASPPGAMLSKAGAWSKGGPPDAVACMEKFSLCDDARATELCQAASAALRSA